MRLFSLVFAMIALAATVVGSGPMRAETLVGSNVDSRVIVGMKANADGVQTFLPDGWSVVPFPGGPLKGANLLFVMIDSRLEMDPEGKPLTPASRRAVALIGLGKQVDGDAVRMFVLRLYTTSPDRDPYSNAQRAAIAREYAETGPADGKRDSSDFWRVIPEAGGKIVVRLDYMTGSRNWVSGETLPYSAAVPDFSRIYRYDQLVEVVMSQGMGKPMNGELKLDISVLELAEALDGTEEVVAVMDVPVYVRKVYLP
ncbi:hypothetical protein [Psychromarinibacter sp. S121]|uniref:hypothetical protein n=1 Tax=Psychromarinibacter sp. S121 TaxID=3415127 RepID=UPI003C7CF939